MAEVTMVQGIVERLHSIGEEKTTLEAEEAMLWAQFYGFIDDTVGQERAYRWTHPELKLTIGRIMADNSPRLDEHKLKEQLTDDQWQICTKQIRAFDLERLTVAVAEDKINKDDVIAATITKPSTARKHFKPASKAELQALEEAKLS